MPKPIDTLDPELAEFEAALLRSVEQAVRGEVAQRHTPEQIAQRRRGRPAGSTGRQAAKVSTTIRLSPDVLEAFRATGPGWQTRIDAALKDWLGQHLPVANGR